MRIDNLKAPEVEAIVPLEEIRFSSYVIWIH